MTRRDSPLTQLKAVSRSTLYLLGLLSAAKALSLIGLASALSSGIVSIIDGTDAWHTAIAWGLVSAIGRGLISWAHRVVSAQAVIGAKERLRSELAERLVSRGGAPLGSTTTLATQGLDELDKYFTVFLPALVSAATIPLLVGARILFADGVSAAIIVLTIPLIPVFMTLIGSHTQDRVAAATDALARLSDHLVELARGLPVLVGLGRAHEQTSALRRISEDYRARTVQTLRTAFLSSLALELIATLSVAVVAVFIGVRLVYGQMPLELGLLALLLAPECYTPFREVGAAFHAAQDGQEALSRARAAVDEPVGQSICQRSDGPLRVQRLSVSYPGRNTEVVSALSFEAASGKVTVLDGPSGSGKSTIFGVLTGRLVGTDDGPRITGQVTGVDVSSLAWLPQHPHSVADTLEKELLLYGGDTPDAAHLARSVLDELGLAPLANADPGLISPGELRRLAFGRIMMRVHAGAELVLLDEPTAHLDAVSAGILISAIARLRGRVTIILASHDDAVRALADDRIALGGRASRSAANRLGAGEVSPPRYRESGRSLETEHPFRELLAFLRPVAGRLLCSVTLGTLSALFAIALTALSAWLIVRASEQPPIMYLLVAIVGVRFFGIGRAVLRYSERLASHNTIFAALTTLRMRLWTGLAARGAGHRAMLRPGSTLDRLVRDVDQVRDLSIRVGLPLLSGLLTTVVALIGLSMIHPPLLPLFLGLGVITLLLAPVVALLADRAAARAEQLLRSEVLRRFAAMLGAADDLRANGVDAPIRRQLRALDASASDRARRGAWALGLGNAIALVACCSAAILVLPLSGTAVAAGTLEPGLVAVLALTPLGLIEPVQELVAAVQRWPALRGVLGRVSTLTEETPEGLDGAPLNSPINSVTLEEVSAAWPGSSSTVFYGLNAAVRRGEWLVVTGPSGSGKSTLLALLLRQLRPAGGRYLVNTTDTAELNARLLRRRFAWCPQEGHLFSSSLRANLLIARERDDAPSDAELEQVIRRVGLGVLFDRLPDGLATPIGSEGNFLSGGERQRLAMARTLLTRSDVILIDEPTAHLDEESAESLMRDLRSSLGDRTTVLVTHRAVGVRPQDHRLELGTRPAEVLIPDQMIRCSYESATSVHSRP